ncbi:MAG: hypothetical protein F2587_02910 [Actinobacteria bacterium]|uniref:Unannotated protein n=1 Tax=freshwater metagenome TaxID=449393 RepID=A0A6J6H558_9ZZZZ|nr:hypothetical protein [Actinomycetota bacterium]
MMFFTLRNGCSRTSSYIAQNGQDYRLPDTSETASWVSICSRWLNNPSTSFTGNEGISPSVFPHNVEVDFQLPPLKPLFIFYKPVDSAKLTSEVIDIGGGILVNTADLARQEAFIRKIAWDSRRAVA